MIIGFTGTRHGMTSNQKRIVAHLLRKLQPFEVHHGDCIGADAEFHDLAKSVGLIIVHPPNFATNRAFCKAALISKPKHYLVRNRDIVDSSDCIIATPASSVEEVRGGTWYTIRYARKMKKSVLIVFPNGKHSIEK
jgi:hypothetical protein